MNRYRANPKLLPLLLAGLAMIGPFTVDTFFPAFGRIERQFGISALSMQQTLSVYMGAYAVMSLLHGPFSDAYGRRGVIFYSLLVYLFATVGCALAPSFQWLLLFRVLQGMSAGAGMVVGRAMIRDRYAGADAQRLMSQVTLIFGVAPAIAPLVGGWVLYFASWRWIFGVLAVFTVLLTIASLLGLPETHPRARRTPFDPPHLLRTYGAIARDGRFLLLGAAAALNFGGLFVYIASAPVIVLDLLHLNERQFPWLFIPIIGGMSFGAWLSGRVAGTLDAPRTVGLGYALIFGGAALGLGLNSLMAPVLPWLVLPVGITGMGVTLAFPTLTLLMLDRFPAVRGAAASVQAAMSLGSSSIVAGVLAPLAAQSGLDLACGSLGMSVAGFACWMFYWRITPNAQPQVLNAVADMPAAQATEPLAR